MSYFFLIYVFCHLGTGTDDRIRRIDGGRSEVALVVELLCFLFHFDDLDGAGGAVIGVGVGAGAAFDGFDGDEVQDLMTVCGLLDTGLLHVDGDGVVIFPEAFCGNGHRAGSDGSGSCQGDHHFFHSNHSLS